MDEARLEIWFPSTEEVSVFVEATETGPEREVTEAAFFAAYAARQIADFRNDATAQSLSRVLFDQEQLGADEPAPTSVGETRLVPPTPDQGRKGFVARFQYQNGLPRIHLKAKGFGVMGRGVPFYGPTSTQALLFHLLGRHSPEGRRLLVRTARVLGTLGMRGSIFRRSQAGMARLAILAAIEEMEVDPLFIRSDDPEEDYQLLLGKTTRYAAAVSKELADEGTDAFAVPEWLTWRIAREMVLIHYGEWSAETYELRQGASIGPDEYDWAIERQVEMHELGSIADRLRRDLVGRWEDP